MQDMPRESSTCFMTPAQLALLRAALTLEPDAVATSQARLMGDEADLNRLELGSRRLLPLFYHAAQQLISEELRNSLKELYDQYSVENQALLGRLEKVLTWFHANGIPTIVLKGLALSLLHYNDLALRPTSDLDVLVPEERVREVMRLLRQDGWTTDYAFLGAPRNSYFYRHIHAIPFTHPEHGDLDLHWHVLQSATFRDADRPFWDNSVPLRVNTIDTRALNPTDQLLHVSMHGFAADVVAPIRWVADAIIVLRGSQIDWKRLEKLAKWLQVTAPVADALSFLRKDFGAPIPDEVIQELRSVHVHRSDQRYFEHLTIFHRSWRQQVAYNCERHRRVNRDRHPILRLASLPGDLGSFAFYRLGKQVVRKLVR